MTSAARWSSRTMSSRIARISVRSGCAGGDQAPGHLGVREDAGQRLLDLVGEGGGELAHRDEAAHARELVPHAARLDLGVLAVGDVQAGDHGPAALRAQRVDAQLEPPALAPLEGLILGHELLGGPVQHRRQAAQDLGRRPVPLDRADAPPLEVVHADGEMRRGGGPGTAPSLAAMMMPARSRTITLPGSESTMATLSARLWRSASSARRRASTLANTSASRRSRCTSSAGHARSACTVEKDSEPSIT